MESEKKDNLLSWLGECITQLKQAEKALYKEEFVHSAVFISNVQDQLPKIRQQLIKVH